MGIFNNPARDEEGKELKRRRSDQIPFSIIASDMTVVGDLETEGVVRIEGRVRGTVRVGAQVLVAVGAVIEGDLHTQEAVVAGQVSGAIIARDRIDSAEGLIHQHDGGLRRQSTGHADALRLSAGERRRQPLAELAR